MINILITTDDNYIQHATVMMASLLDNTNEKISLYLLYCDLNQHNLDLFKSFIEQYKNKVSFNPINVPFDKYFDKVPIKYHFTRTTFLRLLAPYFIDEKYVVYLDPDIILLDDIANIMKDIYLEDTAIFAVEAISKNKFNIGLLSNEPYFVAGVMILNLDLMRKLNYQEYIDFIKEYYDSIETLDQDVLNGIFRNKWKPLHPKWDVYSNMFYNTNKYIETSLCYTKDVILNAVKKPSIIHFSGSIKPWHYVDKHPYKKYYWKYLKKTPWENYKPNDFSFSNFLKKHLNIPKIRSNIIKFWQCFFVKKKFIYLNRLLYELGLHGIGINNFDTEMKKTGELYFIKTYFQNNDKGIIFDVGAYIGNYSKIILDVTKNVEIYAFEPNPKNFEKLLKNINDKRFKAYNLAVGNYNGYINLFDIDNTGSSLTCFDKNRRHRHPA